MITMDITLVMQIVNMIILMFVLNAVIYKPVLKVLRDRANKLQGMNDGIVKLEENARRRQDEVDSKMATASGKAKAALDGARAEAQTAGDLRLAAIKAESDAVKEKELSDVRSEIASARQELQAGLDGFATAMAGKILGRSL
jgi:F-type H+-transporting ATPase subunit b